MSGAFYLPGRSGRDLFCDVMKVRDGHSFSNRRAVVHQGSGWQFEARLGFRASVQARRSDRSRRTGIEHCTATSPSLGPEVPPPAECVDREQRRADELGQVWIDHPVNAVEVRVTDPRHVEPEVRLPARSLNWVRVPGSEGCSEREHTALLLYASDRSLLSTAALPHGILWTRSQAVTLNHTLWLHQPPVLSNWLLFAAESRIATDGIALIHLEVFDGQTLIATAMQEALVQYSTDHGAAEQ